MIQIPQNHIRYSKSGIHYPSQKGKTYNSELSKVDVLAICI